MNNFNLKKKDLRKKLFFKKNNILFNLGEKIINNKLDLIKNYPSNTIQFGESIKINNSNKKNLILKNFNNLRENQKKFHAFLSNFDLQIYLAFKEIIIKYIYDALDENGLLCFNLITENSFITLRKFFHEIDESVFAGSYRRFGPFHNIQDIIKKLDENNFKETVVSTESLELNYNSFSKIRDDFRTFGISNYYMDKIKFKRNFYLKSEQVFEQIIRKNSYFPIEIEIASFTTWK